MAFVSGGGGGLPPQPGVPTPGGSNGPPVAVQTPTATQLAAHQQLSALAGSQQFLVRIFSLIHSITSHYHSSQVIERSHLNVKGS
ncbi:unnamed protein product [Cylicostephanus goldi]|uniref:Uncharacterized protein n=1 Tax=Cylicostephanus goldi TaxID=71465 RepID=A0A3P6QJA5_CYLGO|nr:unnamed protein product [Cylicostephanus goldi]